MSIRGLLFDKDGTLIEIQGIWAPLYRRMLQDKKGITAATANALMADVGYDPLTDQVLANSLMASGTTRQLLAAWFPELDRSALDQALGEFDDQYTPYGQEFLKELAPLGVLFDELLAMGYQLGLATNDTLQSATCHMTGLGVVEKFSTLVAADTVSQAKPSGDMVRQFAKVTGLPCSEIAMIGDSVHDMQEARRGGAALAIAIASDPKQQSFLQPWADAVLSTVAELPTYLKNFELKLDRTPETKAHVL